MTAAEAWLVALAVWGLGGVDAADSRRRTFHRAATLVALAAFVATAIWKTLP
jgi:hypothetical protein